MTHCMNLGTPNYKDGAETVSLCEIKNSDLSSDLTASALPDKKGLRFMRRPFLSACQRTHAFKEREHGFSCNFGNNKRI